METWSEKLWWMGLGAVVGNLPSFSRWVVRRIGLMPKPRIDRVFLIDGGEGDQWVKARARLSRWRLLGNDAYLNCAVEAVREGTDPVSLLVAGTPEPMPTFSFEPGSEYEVQVAIWLPRADAVDMSRSLRFRLDGQEPRFLSHSLCYGLIDRTPPLPSGPNVIRLRITQQGRRLGERSFRITVDHGFGFTGLSIVS